MWLPSCRQNEVQHLCCAAQHSGCYPICFSLIDKITHLLPTQPRKYKAQVQKEWEAAPFIFHTRCKMHGSDSPQSWHGAITFKGPASLLITENVIAVPCRFLHTILQCWQETNMKPKDALTLQLNCLFNFRFSFAVCPSAWKQQHCLSKLIHK